MTLHPSIIAHASGNKTEPAYTTKARSDDLVEAPSELRICDTDVLFESIVSYGAVNSTATKSRNRMERATDAAVQADQLAPPDSSAESTLPSTSDLSFQLPLEGVPPGTETNLATKDGRLVNIVSLRATVIEAQADTAGFSVPSVGSLGLACMTLTQEAFEIVTKDERACKWGRNVFSDAVHMLVQLVSIAAHPLPFKFVAETCHESPLTALQLPRSNCPLLRRLQQSALLAVLVSLLSTRVDCLTAITNGIVATAATAWATSPTTATTTYGNIGDGNTAAVTSMYRLFNAKPTLDADIGKWNVASVSTMDGTFQSATAFNGNIGSWNAASEMFNLASQT